MAERPRLGRMLVALSLVMVAVLTLMPQQPEPKPFQPWCLVCGDLGGTDVVANVIFFLPLGAGLALAGVGRGKALLVVCAATLTVETLQLAGIPGRTGTLSDLLTNTAGGALGYALAAAWPAWVRPRPRTARRLAALAGAAWLATQAVGAWLFAVPRVAGVPRVPTTLPADAGRPYGWYAGHATAATLDGSPLLHRGTGAVRVRADLQRTATVAATVDLSDARPGLVPFVLVLDERGVERFVLGQLRGDLVAAAGDRPLRLALRRPNAVGRGAFQDPATSELGQTVLPTPLRVAGGLRGDTLWAEARAQGGEVRRGDVVLAPSLGWTVIVPFIRPGTPLGRVVHAAWLAALLLPVGYWTAWSPGRGTRASHAFALGAAAAALVAMLGTWGAAAAGGFTTSPLADALTATAGGALGSVCAALVRRRAARTPAAAATLSARPRAPRS